MRIPKSFNICGQQYKVRMVDGIVSETEEMIEVANGMCQPELCLITLDRNTTRRRLDQVWLHELTHSILFEMGQHALFDDEVFVGTFSNMMHQAFVSSKGEY